MNTVSGHRIWGAPALLVALSACTALPAIETAPDRSAALATQAAIEPIGPLTASATEASGSTPCFGSVPNPPVIETVTEQVLVVPETLNADGTVAQVAIYRTVTRENILPDQGVVEFETPCADIMTPEMIASVQRALAARAYYDGPISGQIDDLTAAAIQRFQTDQGDIQTGILTLRSARSLGLVAIPRDQL